MACTGSTPTWTTTPDRDSVNTCITNASNDDTINILAGTATWTSSLDEFTKALKIIGAGVGQTIIRDGVGGGFPALFIWHTVANHEHRLSGIEFNDNGGGPMTSVDRGKIGFYSQSTGTTTVHVDNCKFNTLNGNPVYCRDCLGLVDHNNFIITGTNKAVVGFHPSWQGVGQSGDNSWGATVNWGSSEFLFLEDNTINHGAVGACWDNFIGFRGVARFNTLVSCTWEEHGTDTGQRDRGTRAIEIYGNVQDAQSTGSTQITDARSGSGFVWGNSTTNVTGSNFVAAALQLDRNVFGPDPWGTASGINPWDNNTGGNPQAGPFTVAGCATPCTALTATVTGAGWSTGGGGQWKNYIIRKVGCAWGHWGNCSSLIDSNTSDTITFRDSDTHGTQVSFSNGDQFDINLVTEALDQPGRGGGSTFTAIGNFFNCSHSGTTATCDSGDPHGLATNDIVAVAGTVCNTCSGTPINPVAAYDGTWVVTGTPTNHTFTYTLPLNPGGDTGFSGTVTKLPGGANSQTDQPIYEWNNTINGSPVHSAAGPNAGNTIRENEHYYNHVTSGFDGTVGVGTGTTIADAPATCTEGVGFVTNDGSWRTGTPTTGYSRQDRFYRCGASNNWVLYYTPFQYPHPLASGAPSPPPPSPSVTPNVILMGEGLT